MGDMKKCLRCNKPLAKHKIMFCSDRCQRAERRRVDSLIKLLDKQQQATIKHYEVEYQRDILERDVFTKKLEREINYNL